MAEISIDGIIRIDIRQKLEGASPCLSLEIALDPKSLHVRETQLGTAVALKGWMQSGKVGGPGLPSRTLWVALPDRMAVKDLTVEKIKEVAVTKRASAIAPLRAPRRDTPDRSESRVAVTTRDEALFAMEQRAARPLARLLGTERIGVTTAALVEINPVFIGPKGNLVIAADLRVSFNLRPAKQVRTAKPVSTAQSNRLHELAKVAVINPEHVVPPPLPVLRDLKAHWDYVILTDDRTWNATAKQPVGVISPSIVSAFNALAQWKSSIGLKTRVVAITEIVGGALGQDFVTGTADLQEVLRRFLSWAHDNWGTAYVLLGGDEKIVPIRRLKIGSAWDKNLPTDLYYSALNPLNDEWKELSEPAIDSQGFDRLMPTISLGRAPASTAAEASIFVSKVKRYEALRYSGNGLAQSWLERILYVSTKWGGNVPSVINRAASFPPGVDQFALDSSNRRAVIRLVDTVHVTQDPNATTTSPDENRFNLVPGKTYYKIHQKVTYRNPQSIQANTANGAISLSQKASAGPTVPGWFYTDWLDHDGPCHDSAGQNYASGWIIVYLPAGAVAQSFDLRLSPALRMDYNLLSDLGGGDFRSIPYDVNAATSKHGWYFSRSATDANPSPADASGHQQPTSWVSVYASAAELSPNSFVLDPGEEADTMSEQERLRKVVTKGMPGWNRQSGLYPDVVDIPDADRQGIDLQYYTQDRLRAKLNEGQHVISIAGHGNPWSTCCSDGMGSFDNTVADNLINWPNCGIVYVNSCLTNRYTDDSLSRHLVMKNSRGGVVGYVGYLDEINIALGQFFEKKFFSSLSLNGSLGQAVDSRATLLFPGSEADINSRETRYTMFIMTLLGDPTLRIHGACREYLLANYLSVAPDAAGQLNVLYLRPDHRIALVKQDPVQGGWARASVIDIGSWASRLSLVRNQDGRLEAIYIGSDNKLYHIWQVTPNSDWSYSKTLDNGSYAKRVTAIPNADKRIEVIYIGSDNKLYHIWQTTNNGWTQSFVLDNGSYAKDLVAMPNKDGRIEVVYIGSDDKL